MLDNASNNDTVVEKVIRKMGFYSGHRCLRYDPHTFDEALPWVKNPSVYNNDASGLAANAPADARKVFESAKPITTH